jgi:adenosine deaminase
MMVKDFGFGLDDLRGFLLNGIDAAWMDDSDKARLRADWSARFDELRAGLATTSQGNP